MWDQVLFIFLGALRQLFLRCVLKTFKEFIFLLLKLEGILICDSDSGDPAWAQGLAFLRAPRWCQCFWFTCGHSDFLPKFPILLFVLILSVHPSSAASAQSLVLALTPGPCPYGVDSAQVSVPRCLDHLSPPRSGRCLSLRTSSTSAALHCCFYAREIFAKA